MPGYMQPTTQTARVSRTLTNKDLRFQTAANPELVSTLWTADLSRVFTPGADFDGSWRLEGAGVHRSVQAGFSTVTQPAVDRKGSQAVLFVLLAERHASEVA